MNYPSVDEIDRIARLADPVVRNLQITQCYYELSRALRQLSGAHANWCAFAAWASKQAGQTIRGEDLLRSFQDQFSTSPELATAAGRIVKVVARLGIRWEAPALRGQILTLLNPAAAFARASEAVARGNRKVFEEIGREFSRYLATFAEDASYDPDKTSRFCAELSPGDPPEGQCLLRDAFAAYSEARFHPDDDVRSELNFFANLLAGFHEQTRLQPEIFEALNAAIGTAEVRSSLLQLLLPGFYLRLRHGVARLLGRKLPLDEAIDLLLGEASRQIRQVITQHLMTLHLSGEVLHLGRDLPASFPQPLGPIANAKLKELLGRIDPTLDTVAESGARDWANFDDRMHFITDFFRCYHARSALFDPPFTDEQVLEVRVGRRPAGPL
ncbi:MAG TPA: hypothetical protein VK633_00730 [Verrucomicrobiae bacterium]|nr:hypothetical protein [Verrucomicrobiae bacterium]